MVKMIADKSFAYRNVDLKVGQEFDAEDAHVGLFQQIGYAHVEASTRPGHAYETRVMDPAARRVGRGSSRKQQVEN